MENRKELESILWDKKEIDKKMMNWSYVQEVKLEINYFGFNLGSYC